MLFILLLMDPYDTILACVSTDYRLQGLDSLTNIE